MRDKFPEKLIRVHKHCKVASRNRHKFFSRCLNRSRYFRASSVGVVKSSVPSKKNIGIANLSPSSFIVSDRVLGNEAFSAQNLAIDRIVQISNGTTPLGFALTVLFVLVFLAVLVRVGLVAAAAFFFILLTLGTSPPLILDQ
jgi:hypothetical protein